MIVKNIAGTKNIGSIITLAVGIVDVGRRIVQEIFPVAIVRIVRQQMLPLRCSFHFIDSFMVFAVVVHAIDVLFDENRSWPNVVVVVEMLENLLFLREIIEHDSFTFAHHLLHHEREMMMEILINDILTGRMTDIDPVLNAFERRRFESAGEEGRIGQNASGGHHAIASGFFVEIFGIVERFTIAVHYQRDR